MTQTLNPNDIDHSDLVIPVDGESDSIDSIKPAFQRLLNLTEVMRQSFLHITSESVVEPGNRDIDDGIKRYRTVANITALKALVVDSDNDKEIAVVIDISDVPVPYMYYHGISEPENIPFVVESAGNTGCWVWVGLGLVGSSPGLPYTDDSGVLQGPTSINQSLVENRIVALNALWIDNQDADSATELASSANNSYVEGAAYNLTGIASGDKIHLVVTLHAQALDFIDAGDNATVGLFVDDVLVRTALVFGPVPDDGLIQPVTLNLIFDATATSHEFELKVKGSASLATGKIFSPLYGVFTVVRP